MVTHYKDAGGPKVDPSTIQIDVPTFGGDAPDTGIPGLTPPPTSIPGLTPPPSSIPGLTPPISPQRQ
jgi:hypothetical protein